MQSARSKVLPSSEVVRRVPLNIGDLDATFGDGARITLQHHEIWETLGTS